MIAFLLCVMVFIFFVISKIMFDSFKAVMSENTTVKEKAFEKINVFVGFLSGALIVVFLVFFMTHRM